MADRATGYKTTALAESIRGRREFLRGLAAAGASFSLAATTGCSQSSGEDPGTSPKRIRIGYQKSSALLNLLRDRKLLEARLAPQLTVEWTEFSAGPQLLEGVNVGSIDFGHGGEAPPVFAQAAGVPMLYVAAEQHGPNAEAILVRRDSPLKSVVELKGKRVALNRGSNVHYFLVKALESAGLDYDAIEAVYLTPADARAAFESGSIDAWAIWDPYYALVEGTGECRLLVDGTGLVENRGFFYAARDFVSRQPDAIRTVIAELATIADWAAAHRPEVASFLAKQLGMDLAVLEACEHRRHYGLRPIDEAVVAYQQNVADTFLRVGLIPQPIRVADAIWNAG